MSISRIAALLCLVFASQDVLAQTKPTPQKPQAPTSKPTATPAAPAPSAPQITTTVFGDWALRCQPGPEGAHQNCEISLTIQEKDQAGPVAKIAIGRPVIGGGLHLLVLLPNNVSFPSTVQIKTDDKDIWGMDVPWQRCIPGACFAETTLKDADLVRWRTLENMGKITFKDAQSNEVGISFSFNGLSQALDALTKRATE